MERETSRPKPRGLFNPNLTLSKMHTADDELPPGEVPNQNEQLNPLRFQSMSLGQFSPYGGQGIITGGRPGQAMFHKQAPGMPPTLDGLNFRGGNNPSIFPPSRPSDSARRLPNMANSMESNNSSRITPEHFYRTVSQESVGKLKIESHHEPMDFVASDLQDLGEIGRGAFGSVNRMIHRESRTEMAVKRIRSTVDEKEQKQLLMDLDVVMRSSDCPYIVKFYGALFWEGDCWICMERMATSLDKFYRFVYLKYTPNKRIPEEILGKIAVATVKALDYLKEELQIMHRDVKPSNILIDRSGNIKLCDFGISGHLVNSIAKTRDAGCRPYMAPERIDTSRSKNGYDVRSDVWSLGITLIELATGEFPYPKWNNVFDQLTQVVKGEPPKLRAQMANGLRFGSGFVDFVNLLTIGDPDARPKYASLLATPYVRDMSCRAVDVAGYFCRVLDTMSDADMVGSLAAEEDGFH